jgi:hypothetical protein
MAAPERDTCQADLAFLARSWTHPEVTRVTTERVTRGRVTSAADVAGLRGDDMAYKKVTWQYGSGTWTNRMSTRGSLLASD